MSAPRLYTYYRSGAAQRVRIGLALKGVAYESVPVHLVRNGGEHLLPAFGAINPQARVAATASPSELASSIGPPTTAKTTILPRLRSTAFSES
jgi:hypothetical protein